MLRSSEVAKIFPSAVESARLPPGGKMGNCISGLLLSKSCDPSDPKPRSPYFVRDSAGAHGGLSLDVLFPGVQCLFT